MSSNKNREQINVQKIEMYWHVNDEELQGSFNHNLLDKRHREGRIIGKFVFTNKQKTNEQCGI